MPKDTKPLGALKRLAEAQAKQGMMYGIQKLGLDTEGRQTILGMDPFNKSRTRAQVAKPGEVEKQIALLQKRAAVAKAKKDAAEEKKVFDELAELMAKAPLGSDEGPSTSEDRFRPTYERITNIPYEEVEGRGRKSRKSKKSKKGGKKTRKGGKTRRH